MIIHITQETYANMLTIFGNPQKKVSAHSLVRSADGHVAQCVHEADIAWHAGNWDYNTRSIGIEHEGWVDQPAYFPNALYEQSAKLTAAVCDTYGIPKDWEHIIGHYQVPGTDHTDPGPDWHRVRYLRLVNFAQPDDDGRRTDVSRSPSGEAELTDPWVALEPGADPAERVRALRRAHETFTTAGTVPRPVRSVVAESWRRSARAGVGPDGTASVELSDGDLGAYRAEHPLARVMPLFRELMGTFAADGEHLLAVCDAHGRLLWVEGHRATRRRADGMNFVPGAGWSESAVGTNAPGTAVAVDRPVQVFAAEHFIRRVQPWTCAAAPVHDPRTGRVLGAVDITGGDGLAHPHSLGFVRAVARAAEAQLALLAPPPTAPDAPLLDALGRDEAELVLNGRRVRLSRRHSEILVLLSQHPEGLSGDELLCAMYADESVTPVTLRAELARLRRLLGPGVLASRPYRLAAAVESDATVVERRLRAGAVTAAAEAYTGPLLPGSQAPAIVRLRERLADGLRAALIAHRDPDLLADWARAPWGEDDLTVWRALAAVRPTAAVRARLAALEAELTAPAGRAAGRAGGATWLQRPPA